MKVELRSSPCGAKRDKLTEVYVSASEKSQHAGKILAETLDDAHRLAEAVNDVASCPSQWDI